MNSPQSPSPIERLKVLINSSTPIVVMETVEEVRALTLVRTACSDLSLAVFEWTIADGLVRSGSGVPAPPPVVQARVEKTSMWSNRDQVVHSETRVSTTPQGNSEAERLARAVLTSFGSDAGAAPAQQKTAIYNSTDPVQALANLESMTIEAVFVLKDFHRHMDNPVVVRRLRDVGQKFSANRRTLVLTAPAIEMPPELASLVEFLDLPLPDRDRLREIIRETYTRLAGTHTLKLQLDANGVDAMAANLRGLTEEAAERAISQTVVGRLALSPDCITDVLDAKKAQLKRSEMLEFVDATDTMASVGGLDNLKHWLRAAPRFLGRPSPPVRPRSAQRRNHSRRPRLRQESLRPSRSRRMEAAPGEVRHRRRLRQIHRRNRKANPESLPGSRGPGPLRPVDRRTGKSLRRKRPRFRLRRRGSLVAPAGVVSFLDAGAQARRLRSRHLQQRNRPAARADPQRPLR